MSVLRRIEIPLIITAICTLLQVVPYYINIPGLLEVSDIFRDWMVLVATHALFVGAITVFISHGRIIRQRREHWPYSIVALIMLVIMAVSGIPLPSIGLGRDNPVFDFIFKNIQTPLSGTMYSIIAFFITSAAYRVFRARNYEAAVVLISGILMVCYNAPIMTAIYPGFKPIGDWIFGVPNMVTMRAVFMGAALGAVALAMRTLLGKERGFLRGGGG
ncbi:MAG: hypothetical protein ACLFVP_06745 [Candidatus Bathyarchaeia archaeon]